MTGDDAKLTSKAKRSAQYALFAKSSSSTDSGFASAVSEPESSYAVAKFRTLGEGVEDPRLPSPVKEVVSKIQAVDSQGYLFVGDPVTLGGDVHVDSNRQWCLLWIPGTGKSLLESVANWLHVASSRLGQKLDQEADWFDAIRTIAVQSVGENVLLATAEGATADPFVCRVGKLFRIPVLRFSVLPKVLRERWLAGQVARSQGDDTLRLNKPVQAWFSWLPGTGVAQPDSRDDATVGTSDRRPGQSVRRGDVDRLLVSLATTVVAVSVRAGGNVSTALQQRLVDRPNGGTRLLVNENLTKNKVADGLLGAGAVGWWLSGHQGSGSVTPQHDIANQGEQNPSEPVMAARVQFEDVCDRSYLIHWTRRRVGPWPDLTQDEYLDDLIFRSGRRRHDELSALCRILASRKLLASGDLTRDRREVTCFASMSLAQMVAKRVFRAHLSRWDFEPYGIAFSVDVLKRQFGARPVVYGDQRSWNALSENDRPFFQLRQSRRGKIDWRQENEWRIVGDVDLSQIGTREAIVFVGRESDLATVQQLSNWPVVVLPQKVSS